ncbi:MAG: hypothetical protein HFH67_09705 [Lachnospiraceae bacterium]|nr:hypothetical protein [Lachnospiraceae bacterium]
MRDGVISNFLIKAGSQVQDSVCRIFGDKGLYRCQEIDEYWIVDWQKKQVEVCQHKITVNYLILTKLDLLMC